MDPRAPNHPSLALERTALAWGRTALALVAVMAFAVRAAVLADTVLAAFAAVPVVLAAGAGLVVARRAARRAAGDAEGIVADGVALVRVVTAAGAGALLLVAATAGPGP